MLRIVADENIAFAEDAFGAFGELRLLPAHDITPANVGAADVLLVRSVTPVDARFARLPNLRFVGTATIGTDHIDTAALAGAGITVHSAPGSNAESVVEYVITALLRLAARRGASLRGRTLGIVGCGSIGSRLAARAPALGLGVVCNDPPRARAAEARGVGHPYVPLARVLADADVVSLHVPLTRTGTDPTHHLIGEAELARMKRSAWLLNTARGGVVENAALRAVLDGGALDAAVLDVWEHEPRFDPALVPLVEIATAHIAGHSFDGKVNGTIMLYEVLLQELGVPGKWDAERALTAGPEDVLELSAADVAPETSDETVWLDALVRRMYPIERDDARFRELLEVPDAERGREFQRQRSRYPRRRTFRRFTLPRAAVPASFQEPVRDGLLVTLR